MYKKIFVYFSFCLILLFVPKILFAQAPLPTEEPIDCTGPNACLCSGGAPDCCAIEGPDGYNCGCGDYNCGGATPAPGGGSGVEVNCPATANCPANNSCVPTSTNNCQNGNGICMPAGSYACNAANINYNSYTDHFLSGESTALHERYCTFGNAQQIVLVGSNYYSRNYNCCPVGSVSTRSNVDRGTYQQRTRNNPYDCNIRDRDQLDYYTSVQWNAICWQEGPQRVCDGCDDDGRCWNCRQEYVTVCDHLTTCRDIDMSYSCLTNCTPTAPSVPALISPSNGAVLSSTQNSLTWNTASQTWGNSCGTPNNRFIIYVGPNSTSLNAYSITSSSLGSVTHTGVSGNNYCWKVRASNGVQTADSEVRCFTINTITDPWWQVKDGDVTTNGDLSSEVPGTQLFDIVGLGGFPGVPVFGGTFNLSGTPARISTTSWNADTTTTQSRIFNYSYFENLIPEDVSFNGVSELVSGGTQYSDGYEWFKATGDVSTTGDINIGNRKVILFVEGGNLNINGKVNLTDGVGFLGAFVEGSINIDSAVLGTPSIEGVYLSNGMFSSGAGTSQLHVRGSIASFGGVNLERDLTNNSAPAELFEFAPDQMLLFPEKLVFRRTKWTEVAP